MIDKIQAMAPEEFELIRLSLVKPNQDGIYTVSASDELRPEQLAEAKRVRSNIHREKAAREAAAKIAANGDPWISYESFQQLTDGDVAQLTEDQISRLVYSADPRFNKDSRLIAAITRSFADATQDMQPAPNDGTAKHEPTSRNASPNPIIVCPQCQIKGHVSTKKSRAKKGLSGGKATGAVLTGGFSLLVTGLSRKEWVTEASCSNCDSQWTF